MKIGILGATSQIAKDLIVSFSAGADFDLHLFARRPEAVMQWLTSVGLAARYAVGDFPAFTSKLHFDAILNFVGVGNPAQALALGASIFDLTLKYDELVLNYVRQHPHCRYIFLSSGAAYGSSFDEPADENTKAVIPINNLLPQDWYGVAKLHAECRHRSLAHLPIIDIRVFNYFSRTQDLAARFLITDILRAIREKAIFATSAATIVRDFIHPSDFANLVRAILTASATNTVVDCYSKAPVDKIQLLISMQESFGLQYEFVENSLHINATGSKPNYFTLNRRAADFGYEPSKTALEAVMQELHAVMKIK